MLKHVGLRTATKHSKGIPTKETRVEWRFWLCGLLHFTLESCLRTVIVYSFFLSFLFLFVSFSFIGSCSVKASNVIAAKMKARRFAGFLSIYIKRKSRLLRWRLLVCIYCVRVSVRVCLWDYNCIRNDSLCFWFLFFDFQDGYDEDSLDVKCTDYDGDILKIIIMIILLLPILLLLLIMMIMGVFDRSGSCKLTSFDRF